MKGFVCLICFQIISCASSKSSHQINNAGVVSTSQLSPVTQDLTKKKYFIPGLVLGGLTGLGIVALIAKQEKWITVDLSTIAAGVVPGMVVGGAIGIALSGDDDE